MTAEEFGAMVRTVIQLIAGILIAKGIGDQQLWLAITAGAVSIASGIYSFYFIKKAGKAIAQAPSQ